MLVIGNLIELFIVYFILDEIAGISFNQPKFGPSAKWNPNATTFIFNTTTAYSPNGIFIDTNNGIYLAEENPNAIKIWLNENTIPSRTISAGINFPKAVFATNNGDIYVDNGYTYGHVEKWTLNSTSGVVVMDVPDSCYSLFVSINHILYCSLTDKDVVLKVSLNSSGITATTAAGTGNKGSGSSMLDEPYGIFVDSNIKLYVADCGNNRIQMFSSGQVNGLTIAGNNAPGTISLNCPTGIMLDADGFLFIVEGNGHRIVRSSPNGYQCIVGCLSNGISPDQLLYPYNFAFDTDGNIFVSDKGNRRIQKFFLIKNNSDPSYNQPKLSSCATWKLDAITFANVNIVHLNPYGIFIDTKNNIYIADKNYNHVYAWLDGNPIPTRNLSYNLISPFAIFVTSNGDIYVDNGKSFGQVNKWSLNTTTPTSVMSVPMNGSCWGLFVDIYGNIYCSVFNFHKVMKRLFTNSPNVTSIIAGNGISGSAPNMLNNPRGIFVDIELNLYVADSSNHRIQLFRFGQSNGTAIVGSQASGTIALNYPTGIVLDADGYLFISDTNNNRIIGSGPNGFRCIVGCLGNNGNRSDSLNSPWGLAFDRYGNLFVVDAYNNRIQKFLLAKNSCEISFNQPKFASCAAWDPDALTIANISVVGTTPHDIFIDINNTVYVTNENDGKVVIWSSENITHAWSISGGLNITKSIFVAPNGDLYVDNSFLYHRIDKWTFNRTNSVTVTYIPGICFGLFIDVYDYLYCSTETPHQVIKHSLYSDVNNSITIAGNGTPGSASNMLDSPRGIFVDVNLTVYVADCGNNRIQYFRLGQSNGITMAINGSNGFFILNCPTEIVFDGNGYPYIADNRNNRILGSGPAGFRCIVGCTNTSGSASNQLDWPHSLSFDSIGNLFVVDFRNNRLQKFFLSSNFCNITTISIITSSTTATSTTTTTTTSTSSTSSSTTTSSTSSSTTTTTSISSTSTTASTTIIPNNQSCFLPGVTLIPEATSFSSPLVSSRNQGFSISSYIVLHCNISLSMITWWTIYNCTSSNCSVPISIDSSVQREYSELYIPGRILQNGIYRFELTVNMSTYLNLGVSSSAYIKITDPGMSVNLVPYGTSMITHGYEADLIIDPGSYSFYDDGSVLNTTDWNYKYYCRIYGISQYPYINGSELTIDDPRTSSINPSCLSNRTDNQTGWKYESAIQSSLTILAGSLQSNRTYQFMARLENRYNASIRPIGYLLVRIVDTYSPMIVIGCVISTLCASNEQFQRMNPTSQVALFSICVGNCSLLESSIRWNIYQGSNGSLSTIQWKLFTPNNSLWFFGRNTSNLTVVKEFFLNNRDVTYWRLEVVYSFPTGTSSSSFNIVLNESPKNGSCSIDPLNGTTTTSFTIWCSDWFDEDGIKDYSVYSYQNEYSVRKLIGFSFVSRFEVRLSVENTNISEINLVVEIRDRFDCISESNISSIVIRSDSSSFTELLKTFENSSDSLNENSLVRLLSSGNQNTVVQILTSVSEQVNQMNKEKMEESLSNGVDVSSISISSLGSESSEQIFVSMNESALNEYKKQQNSLANLVDYLMGFTKNLLISTSASIRLQASSLVQLTKTTNQLTRSSVMIGSNRCYQLAQSLYLMSNRIPSEDVQNAMNDLIQCASNVLTAVNGPLQGRTKVLDLDEIRANQLPDDYDTDLEFPWSNQRLFVDGNDDSWENIVKSRNIYYQKEQAKEILDQTKKTISLLSDAMKIHLNLGQNQLINTSSVLMSMETMTIESLSNKTFQPMRNIQIDLQSNINSSIAINQTILLRLLVNPLASSDQSGSQSNTNLSRSISLSILDENGNEISLSNVANYSYRLIIPRDPNLILPSMTIQNVTSINSTSHHLLFNLHHISLSRSNNLSISIHVQMKPLNENLAYLFIYRFDNVPQLNSSINQIHGWSLFCHSNLSVDNLYEYFLDNEMTDGHQSLIFGLRELDFNEMNYFCSNESKNIDVPITDNAFHFTSNYAIRIYTSGCYYLDENNQWKSDGLRVGPKTNVNETECYSKMKL